MLSTRMTALHFALEPTPAGVRVALRHADGTWLLSSRPLSSIDQAMEAVLHLRAALPNDWRYRIVRRRGEGPRFLLRIPHLGAEWTSPPFSSCDAMERTIALLRACGPEAPVEQPLQLNDIAMACCSSPSVSAAVPYDVA
jgi:hypothetical protein